MNGKENEEIVNVNLRLAHLLSSLMKKNNWTQERLSEISTIDYKHIQRLESTKYNNDFRFSTLKKLSNAFEIELLDFLKYILSDETYTLGKIDSDWGKVAETPKKYKP